MTVDWESTTWGELATLEYGKSLTGYENASGDYPVYGTNGIIGWHSKPLFEKAGVIIGRKGAYRGVHYSKTPFFVIDTAFYLKPKNELDLRWAYYQLLTQDINSMDSGSAIPSTSRLDFYALPVRLPPLPEQCSIAGILGALDDKIELNSRMNATLEAVASAVFRRWFVESEDVENWDVGRLGDVADNVRRGANPEEIEFDTLYIGLEHMPRGSIALLDWSNANNVVSNKFFFRQGEFLFGKLRPYFHKVGIAPLNGVCSTDILVIVPKSPEWYGFVLGHISSIKLINYTNAASTGTKMPRTNWSDISRYEVPMPPVNIAKEFNKLFKPMAQQILANIMQSRTLAKLRDTLLPKLMRGEMRVRDIESKG